MLKQSELTEEQIDEAMGNGEARAGEHSWASSGNHKPLTKAKYIVKHKASGKVHSVHTDAPSAVRARAKIGGPDTHAIIKEETDLMEQVKELINAIQLGKTTDIDSAFTEIMSNKLALAVDDRRNEIAASLFSMQEESVEEAVVPGSVHKDKAGNVLGAKTVPDKEHGDAHRPEDKRYNARSARRDSEDDRKMAYYNSKKK